MERDTITQVDYSSDFSLVHASHKETCPGWSEAELDMEGSCISSRLWLNLTSNRKGGLTSRIEVSLCLATDAPYVYVMLYISDDEGNLLEPGVRERISKYLEQGADLAIAFVRECRKRGNPVQTLNVIEQCIDTSQALPGGMELVHKIPLPKSIPGNPTADSSPVPTVVPVLGSGWF